MESQQIRVPELPEPPVFQLKGKTGWIYKIKIGNDRNVIDCKLYISNSGMSSEGCYRIWIDENGNIEAKIVRGLWIEDWQKLYVESDSKFTRDKLVIPEVFLKTFGNFLRTLTTGRKYLVTFTNYGITVYLAHKAPTYVSEPFIEQGHLEIYKVESIPDYLEFYDYPLILYNHYAEGQVKLIHAGDGILVNVEDKLEIKSEDHNPIVLEKGIYLLVHPPVRKAD
ncbi:hypothetical protein AFV7_gp12 [Betalipothrixvirus pezzuloense]|uniref:Uncharacterized protein n=1 Tax=Betalipothrixvirus pezzuloense TaxID=346883 RepID=A7WKN1_9VIRU|nr:hypothetical protein AFV7_gp12 [Acidianus filamentous virus 7]CAJ31631.1 conserved hypothetical protein [Acidianus filamentous virus 7]